jgi:phospholipase/carboxylesterase
MSLFKNCPHAIAETAENPDPLFVFLHGYGSDGYDLLGLGDFYHTYFPNALFLSPHAPIKMPFGGHQWFPLNNFSREEVLEGVQEAATSLHADLEGVLKTYNIPHNRLILGGFSQGCMMALHVGLRLSAPPFAILGFSGLLAGGEEMLEGIKVRPPIFLAHGDTDTVVPTQKTFEAADALKKQGFNVETHISSNSGHTITPQAVQESLNFLKKHENPAKD